MKKSLTEKMLNKLGYVRKDSLVQPIILKQDILQGRKLRTKQLFSVGEFINMDEVTIKKIVTKRFQDELYKYCDFVMEPDDYKRNLITVTATLNLLERNK